MWCKDKWNPERMDLLIFVTTTASLVLTHGPVNQIERRVFNVLQVDWNQAIDMQQSVVGWKATVQRGKKDSPELREGGPAKHSVHRNRNFTASPERVGEKKWPPEASATWVDTFVCFCLSWFHLLYCLFTFPPVFSCSFPVLPLSLPLMLSPNRSRAHRCEGCVSNLPQVQIKCFCCDKCRAAFPHSNYLLLHSNCFKGQALNSI